MLFAKLLRLRDKITKKRQQMHFDEEKPFLEHLEDLRKTITKIVLTLLICALGGMFFYKKFLTIVKWPAQKAGLDIVADPNIPKDSNPESWEEVKRLARQINSVPEAQRTAFLETMRSVNPSMTLQAEAMNIHTAAGYFAPRKDAKGNSREPQPMELATRDLFVQKATAGNEVLAQAVKDLVDGKVRPETEAAKPVIELVWRKPAESFFTAMKLSLMAGVVVAFPLILYFLLEFILPGLTSREKKLLWPALGIGFGLFLIGVTFAFFWVIPRTLEFFHLWGLDIEGTKDLWTFADYTSFVTSFSLVFGLSFELPVVVLAMCRLGLLSSQLMRSTRSYAIIIIAVLAAVITPTGDPGTMAALGVPMVLMYEACIWIAYYMERKAAKKEALEEEERQQERRAYAESQARLALEAPIGSVARSQDDPDGDSDSGVGFDPGHGPNGGGDGDGDQPHRDAPHHQDAYQREELSRLDEPEHPPIKPYDQHASDADHDAWLREQEEIYRREHAHLFGDKVDTEELDQTTDQATDRTEPKDEPPSDKR